LHDMQLDRKKRTQPLNIESSSLMLVEDTQNEGHVISLREPLQIIRRQIWLITLITALFVGAAVGFSLLQTPVYEAKIKILVGLQRDGSVPLNLGSDIAGLQQLTLTMAEAVDTRPVAEAVTDELNLQESPEALLEDLSAQQMPNTQFIEVSYKDTNPRRAQLVVNRIGQEFSEQVSDVSPSGNGVNATVWERAITPQAPVSPKPLLNSLVALVVGGMLGLGLAFLLEHLDDRWRSPQEAEQIFGVPALGVIPSFKPFKVKGRS
jgi:capsular polysaccharide biosynthesis protein